MATPLCHTSAYFKHDGKGIRTCKAEALWSATVSLAHSVFCMNECHHWTQLKVPVETRGWFKYIYGTRGQTCTQCRHLCGTGPIGLVVAHPCSHISLTFWHFQMFTSSFKSIDSTVPTICFFFYRLVYTFFYKLVSPPA